MRTSTLTARVIANMRILHKGIYAVALLALTGQALARVDVSLVQYNLKFKPSAKGAMESPTMRTVEEHKAALTFLMPDKKSIAIEVTPKVSAAGIATLISFNGYGDSFSSVMRGDFKVAFTTDKRGHLVAKLESASGKSKTHIVLGTNTTLSGSTLVVHPLIVPGT